MKCKNIECENEAEGKKVYCSLKCRNVYVNKYVRNYDKVKETVRKKKEERINNYLEEPKKCKKCYDIIEYDKRRNDFCNHSCSASFVNSDREHHWGNKIKDGLDRYLEDIGYKKSIECKNDNCDKPIEKIKRRLFCSNKCRKEEKRRNMDDKQKYKSLTNFKFNLSDYGGEFDFTLVEKHGWYSPTNKNNNLGGVSRDHIYSVMEGFKNNINPHLLSHPANCRLMIHNDNISKNKKCDITLGELIEKIEKWELKYSS